MTRQQTAASHQLPFLRSPLAPPSIPSSSLGQPSDTITRWGAAIPRQVIIGLILVIALLSFEIFNFDTTQYALTSLLGEASFLGLGWATILAIAFCAIDFAGLAHLFTPERGRQEAKEVWYLMGAWLLGATMNALMTWWAVSLTLLSHELGNEVMSREELLQIVPVFVAVLVWLTRILFIGAFSVAGDHLFRPAYVPDVAQSAWPSRAVPAVMRRKENALPRVATEMPDPVVEATVPAAPIMPDPANSRPVQQRPAPGGYVTPRTVPIAAQSRRR